MFGYIYETTNLINGKKYIGKHKSSKFDIRYKGSGVNLEKAFNKYGKESFQVVILEECSTQEELDTTEELFIAKTNAAKSSQYYNIVPYSFGGDTYKYLSEDVLDEIYLNRAKRGQTDETRKKISLANKGKRKGYRTSEEVKNKMRVSHRTYQTEETKRKISESNKGRRLGKVFTPEQKTYLKQINAQNKYRWITNEVQTLKVKEVEIQTYVDQGYRIGRPFNWSTRK